MQTTLRIPPDGSERKAKRGIQGSRNHRKNLKAGGNAGIAMELPPIPTKTGHCTGDRCYSISCQQDERDLFFLFLPV